MVETIKDINLVYEYKNKNNIFIKDDKNSTKPQEDQAAVEITNDDIIMDIVNHITSYTDVYWSLSCSSNSIESQIIRFKMRGRIIWYFRSLTSSFIDPVIMVFEIVLYVFIGSYFLLFFSLKFVPVCFWWLWLYFYSQILDLPLLTD